MKVKFIQTFTAVLFQFVLFQVVATNFSLAQDFTKKDAERVCRGWLTDKDGSDWNDCITTQTQRLGVNNSVKKKDFLQIARNKCGGRITVRESDDFRYCVKTQLQQLKGGVAVKDSHSTQSVAQSGGRLSPHERTCLDLGFKKKTENFGNCVLELYGREQGGSGTSQTATVQNGDGTPEDATCRRYGAALGTGEYASCRVQLLQVRFQQQQYERQAQIYAEQKALAEKQREQARAEKMLRFGLGMMSSTSPYFSDGLARGAMAAELGYLPPQPTPPEPVIVNLPGMRLRCSSFGNTYTCR